MSGHRSGAEDRPATSQCPLLLSLDIHRMLDRSTWQQVRADFRFDQKSPLVVAVEFLAEDVRVTWSIGRDVLRQGLVSMSGTGDVQVRPTHLGERTAAWLRLTAGDVTALFALPVAPLEEWLERTYQVVPAGDEMNGASWDVFTTGALANA
ncbi:SsgA family sporulation/cell division regulator, partial [Streptomyces fagopyri]